MERFFKGVNTELFSYLDEAVVKHAFPVGKIVVATQDEDVVSSSTELVCSPTLALATTKKLTPE